MPLPSAVTWFYRRVTAALLATVTTGFALVLIMQHPAGAAPVPAPNGPSLTATINWLKNNLPALTLRNESGGYDDTHDTETVQIRDVNANQCTLTLHYYRRLDISRDPPLPFSKTVIYDEFVRIPFDQAKPELVVADPDESPRQNVSIYFPAKVVQITAGPDNTEAIYSPEDAPSVPFANSIGKQQGLKALKRLAQLCQKAPLF
jgi:hypothetical protein